MHAKAEARRQLWLSTARLVFVTSVGIWREPSIRSQLNLTSKRDSAVWLSGDILPLRAPVSILSMGEVISPRVGL